MQHSPKTSPILWAVFQSQLFLSQNDFPEINPSPRIRTKKFGTKVSTALLPKFSNSLNPSPSINPSQTQSISSIFSQVNNQISSSSDPDILAQDSYITPAQRLRKQQERPVLFHLTSTYWEVVNRLNWDTTNSSNNIFKFSQTSQPNNNQENSFSSSSNPPYEFNKRTLRKLEFRSVCTLCYLYFRYRWTKDENKWEEWIYMIEKDSDKKTMIHSTNIRLP